MNEIYLKYIGAGSWLPDVPARDLTKAEAEYHGIGRLLDSRLYERYREEINIHDFAEKAKQAKAELDTDTQYGSTKKRGKQ